MENCPFRIHDWVQTNSLGVGKVSAFVKEKDGWKIQVTFQPHKKDAINSCWFWYGSIRLATRVEILLYG